jgi:hypothetical protein
MRGLLSLARAFWRLVVFMKKFTVKLFLISLLILLFVACGGQVKDKLKPVLTLSGEPTRTVNTNSVLIEGALQDNTRVASFSYSLNGGNATDAMNSLQGKKFKFLVENLILGKNSISLVAIDTSGNETTFTVNVEMTPTDPVDSSPKIELAGGNYYQISADNIILEGNVSDDVGVALFTYALNDNAPIDMTNTLEEGMFTVELINLKKGFNNVYFSATDTLGNKTELTVEIATQFVDAPDITGLWGQQPKVFIVCESQEETAMSFNFDKPSASGKITGTSTIQNYSGRRSGQINGYVTSPKSFWLDFAYDDGTSLQAYMNVQKGELVGQIRLDDIAWCNAVAWTTAFLDVTLGKDISLTNPPVDLAFEPNNRRDQAKEIPTNTTLSLSTPYNDEEWFKITITEKSLLDFSLKNSSDQAMTGLQLEVYQSDSLDNTTFFVSNKIVLEAGSYYLNWEFGGDYTLTLTKRPIPDANYEPNDTRSTATLINEGFNDDFVIDGREDRDWFKFTLGETRVVTVDFGKPITTFATVDIVRYNQEPNLSNNFFTNSIVKILPAGTHYLFVGNDYDIQGGAKTYSFNFSTKPLVDEVYEPNNTKDKAILLTNGFDTTMFVGGGDECDIFKFTLNEIKRITLDLGSEKFNYHLYGERFNYINTYPYEGVPIHQYYGPSTHYISVCLDGGLFNNYPDRHRTYPVRFTVE